MSGVVEKYRALDISRTKIHVSLADAEALSVGLAAAMAAQAPDLLVGLANGALLPTWIVADRLGVPFEMVRIQREGGRLKARLLAIVSLIPFADAVIRWRAVRGLVLAVERLMFARKYLRHRIAAESFAFDVTGKSVAVVDDCMVTGGSIRVVRQRLLDAGARAVSVNVLCWVDQSDEARPATAEPDSWLHRFVHFYPWSGNSPHAGEYRRWLQRHGLTAWE